MEEGDYYSLPLGTPSVIAHRWYSASMVFKVTRTIILPFQIKKYRPQEINLLVEDHGICR